MGLFLPRRQTLPPLKCPLLKPMCRLQGPNDNYFVNTADMDAGGGICALSDQPHCLRLDDDGLSVRASGEADLWGYSSGQTSTFKMAMLGTAHPVRRPGTASEWVALNMQLGATASEVGVISVGGNKTYGAFDPATLVPGRRVPWLPYLHSFAVTAHEAVLPLQPVHMSMATVMDGKPMMEAFEEIPEMGNRTLIAIVPLHGDGNRTVETFDAPRFFYTHTINAFREGGDLDGALVLDVCVADENPFTTRLLELAVARNKTARDALYAASTKVRVRVARLRRPAGGGAATLVTLSDPGMATDFVKINPAFEGVRHCYYWGVVWGVDGKAYGGMGLVKQTVCGDVGGTGGGGRRLWQRDGWFPSEPVFVARATADEESAAGAEDDGVLIFSALHGAANTSYLIVADAASMETLLELALPTIIPFTTHGQFYPGTTGRH